MLKGAFLVFCALFLEISANLRRSQGVYPAGSSNDSTSTMIGDDSLLLTDKRARLKASTELHRILQEKGLLAFRGDNNGSREFALMGSISDEINLNAAPRDYKVIRGHSVKMFDEEGGNFNVYVSSNSLSAGDEYFYLQGSFSEGNLETTLDYCEVVSKDKFRGVMEEEEEEEEKEGDEGERERDKWFQFFNQEQVGGSFIKRPRGSINNGSKGREGKKREEGRCGS